jgi:predicted nucleic-acid-binding protein
MTMIGLDTNVVIRLLTNDDPQQRRAALKFAEGLGQSHTAFLTLIGIVELDWALRSRLGFSKQDALSAIGRLLRTRGLIVEHHDLVVNAVRLASKDNADLADALIAARSLQAGCKSIKTFDKQAAARVPGMEVLA